MRRLNTLTFRKAAMRSIATLAVLASALVVGGADCFGAIILHVDTGTSDGRRAKNVSEILIAAGHAVTSLTPTDAQDGFDALNDPNLGVNQLVIWDSTNSAPSGTIEHLSNFVKAGGKLLVIGYDAIYSEAEQATNPFTELYVLLGGATADDAVVSRNSLNPVSNIENSLTTGVFDIREELPFAPSDAAVDLDTLNDLIDGIAVVTSTSGGNHWTLRKLGNKGGEVAFMSTPSGFDFQTNDVYKSALLNFAHSANSVVINYEDDEPSDPLETTPEPATLAIWAGLSAVGLIAARRKQKATA